jgi:hypothetical protein
VNYTICQGGGGMFTSQTDATPPTHTKLFSKIFLGR